MASAVSTAEFGAQIEPLRVVGEVLRAHPNLWFVFCPLWLASTFLAAVGWRPTSAVGRRLAAGRPHPSGWLVILLVWAFGVVANLIHVLATLPGPRDSSEPIPFRIWQFSWHEAVALTVVGMLVLAVLAFQRAAWGHRGIALQAFISAVTVAATFAFLGGLTLVLLVAFD